MEISDIFVLKDGKRFGPYSADEVLVLIDEERFTYEDVCLRRGDAQTRRLRDILDWEEKPETVATSSAPAARKPDTFFPHPLPIEKAHQRPGRKLESGEIVYRAHPSVLNYATILMLAAISFVAGAILSSRSLAFFLGGLLVVLLVYIFIVFERMMKMYLVTPERVEIIQGILSKSSKEVRIRDIRAINVKTTGLKGMIGVGDVEFASAGSGEVEVEFQGVWRPHRVKQLVRVMQNGQQ